MIEYSAGSIKGRGRYENQDRIMVDDIVIYEGCLDGIKENEFSAVVCDGVGGTRGGAEAAEIVAMGFKNFDVHSASPFSVNKHLKGLNQMIVSEQKTNQNHRRMATTTAGLFLCGNRYMVFNLGDTHIYRIKDASISLKSVDHTMKADSLRLKNSGGKVNPDALTRYLGGFGCACNPTISIGHLSEKESYFVICSDGIYKKVEKETLKEIIMSSRKLDEKRRAIMDLSIQNGSLDDKSIVLVKYSAA